MQSAHVQTTEIINSKGWDAKSLRPGAGKGEIYINIVMP